MKSAGLPAGRNIILGISSFLLFVSYVPPFFTTGDNNYGQKLTFSESHIEVEFPDIQVKVGTYLGNETRNFYGYNPPLKLDIIWKHFLGSGKTVVTEEEGTEIWYGAGWTGQPLIIREKDKDFLLIGAFDYNLKKIDVATGKLVWQYRYDDIIKGTGTFCVNQESTDPEKKYYIIQGSRKGYENPQSPDSISSFRAVSYLSGKELWRMRIKKTDSYSRDVDGSTLVINDTAYIGLENGLLMVFDANNGYESEGIKRPEVISQHPLYSDLDRARHGGNLVTESSPCRIGNHIYITSGSGHVYGYNLNSGKIDWDFLTGSDMDGSPVATSDSCLIVTIEKQYISGQGGVMKLDPSKEPDDAVVWFFPTGDVEFADWEGGVIGSASVIDLYAPEKSVCAFNAIDGYMYVVDHKKTDKVNLVAGPDGKTMFPKPKLLFKYKTGPSISTPLVFKDVIVSAGYSGVYLFNFNDSLRFTLLDFFEGIFEATPVANDGKIFIASRDGFLYSLGDTLSTDACDGDIVLTNLSEEKRKIKIDFEIFQKGFTKVSDFLEIASNKLNNILKTEKGNVKIQSELLIAETAERGVSGNIAMKLSKKYSGLLIASLSENAVNYEGSHQQQSEIPNTIAAIEEKQVSEKTKDNIYRLPDMIHTWVTCNISAKANKKWLLAGLRTTAISKTKKQIIPDYFDNTVSVSSGPYHIIAGSFSIKENAERYYNKLNAKGYHTSILGPTKGFYYIPLYSFSTREEADSVLRKVATGEFKDVWIMKF